MKTVKSTVSQTLSDAGCSRAAVCEIESLLNNGKKREAIILLTAHRKKLLEKLHIKQRNLACLDYLIYTLKQEDKK